MNTCVQAGTLVPLARYDTRYARAIGKWLLNLANAARLFYPGELPPGHGSSEFWTGDPQSSPMKDAVCLAGKKPCATGDPVAFQWGPKTDLGLYGSSYAGLLGARANHQRPADPATGLPGHRLPSRAGMPTYLCYNPHPDRREFTIAVGSAEADIYDSARHALVARRVSGPAVVSLPPDSAAVFVILPTGKPLVRDGHSLRCDSVVIDWNVEPVTRN